MTSAFPAAYPDAQTTAKSGFVTFGWLFPDVGHRGWQTFQLFGGQATCKEAVP